MKKNLFIALAIIILVAIGGAWHMKRAKDLAELHEIQTDLANYLYNNYRIYTFNKEELDQLDKAYDAGKMTYPEYSKCLDEIAKYSDISKIEFTGFSVSPMNILKVQYTINDVLDKETSLDTISAETKNLIFRVGEHDGKGEYSLEKKKEATNVSLPENLVIYYEGGIK